jgi:hypothetical protein
MNRTWKLTGAVAVGALMVASCGGDSLEDGWDDLSAEEQESICELFNSDAMTDEVMEQIVTAANEAEDDDVTVEEFRSLLEDNC